MDRKQRGVGRTVSRLALVALAMFGFGYALVPLYNVACEKLGLNGRSSALAQPQAPEQISGTVANRGRTVTVEFVGNAAAGLPWEFRPSVPRMTVRAGELVETTFHARNLSDHTIVGQAVPSVAPGRAARHFNKIECFCFTRQSLAAGEAKDMRVRFKVDPALDPAVGTVTLSYTFFDTAGAVAPPAG